MDIRALFLSGTDSPEFALSSYRGRVLVLDFWATWSDSCRAELPLLGRLSAEWKSQDVALVGMAVDRGNRAEITEAVKGLNLSYPVAWADDNVQRAFGGIRAVPTRILVDKKGQIRKQLPGILPEDLLRAEVGALLAEN
jgi:thiol-disulfide isomerase/thioredoxin